MSATVADMCNLLADIRGICRIFEEEVVAMI